jgi:putative ABC transport system substrate-binding protein
MRRREFFTLIGCARLHPACYERAVAARSNHWSSIHRLTRRNEPRYCSRILYGLAEMGYIDGNNVKVERRWAGGEYARLPELVRELIRLNPALIAMGGNVAALAVSQVLQPYPRKSRRCLGPRWLLLGTLDLSPNFNSDGDRLLSLES